MVDQQFVQKKTLRSVEQWQALVQGWQKGDKSQNAFCREQNLSSSLFGKWVRKLKALNLIDSNKEKACQTVPKDLKTVGMSNFIPVQVSGEQALMSSSRKLDLVLVCGHRLSFQGDWPPQELMSLLGPLVKHHDCQWRAESVCGASAS